MQVVYFLDVFFYLDVSLLLVWNCSEEITNFLPTLSFFRFIRIINAFLVLFTHGNILFFLTFIKQMNFSPWHYVFNAKF